MLRYSPAFNLMKRLDRRPGQRAGDERGLPRRPVHPDPGPLRLDVAGRPATKAGSGTLLEHSIHDLDIIEYCVGPIAVGERPVGATSTASTASRTRVAATLAFAGGAVGALTRCGTTSSSGRACAGSRSSASGATSALERRLVRAGLVDRRRRRRGARSAVTTWWRSAGGGVIDRGNPDGAFIRAVADGAPAWPDFHDALASPCGGRRRLSLGGRRRGSGGAAVERPVVVAGGLVTSSSPLFDGPDGPGLLEGLCSTRAIRRFRPEPVPDADLATMLFAATRAPSGSNRQPFRFVVLRDGPAAREAKALLGGSFRSMWAEKRRDEGYDRGSAGEGPSPKARVAAAMQHFVDSFEQTPVVVLACLERYRGPNPYEGASVYPACQNLLLAARALGYGGVMTTWHQLVERELRALLDVPDQVFVAATIPLGRPEGRHGPVRRRPLGELVFDDRWGEPASWAADPPGTRYTRAGPPG